MSAETTVGEVCLEAKAAHPAPIRYGDWLITYLGSWDVSKIIEKLEKENRI